MALITIDGVALVAPVGYKVTQSDLDSSDSGRSETGIMQRNRVRQGIAKIEASWEKLTETEMATILLATEPAAFNVNYYFGKTYTAEMYAGDRNADLVCIDDNGKSRWNVSVNLIEY